MHLEPLLDAATQATNPESLRGDPLFYAIHRAAVGEADLSDPVRQLVEGLRGDPRLDLFAGRMQIVPGQAARVDHSTLAVWLVQRARAAGSARAIADLERYLRTETIDYLLTIALDG